MDERRSDQGSNHSTAGETARMFVTQSLYGLVKLTRMGLQVAATGVGKLEQTMAQRQKSRHDEKLSGEAPPGTDPSDTGQSKH